jgi:hypothetical protein
MSPAATHASHTGPEPRREPWLGLTPYSEADSEIFHGRAREAGELLRLVQRNVLTVLFGPSGTGKSSLLNAGVFPLLREEKFLPVAIRLDHSPNAPGHVAAIRRRIAETVAREGIEEVPLCGPPDPPEQETLWEYLHRVELWDKRHHLLTPVLVFDQFEEAFTLALDRPATQEFLRELADLVENYVPAAVRGRLERRGAKLGFKHQEHHYRVLLSLREDFVFRLDGLRKSMPSVMFNRFRLERMDGERALEAVTGPGAGIVSDRVAREIVRFVAASNGLAAIGAAGETSGLTVEPALLSVVCRELNARRIQKGGASITREDLAAGEADILSDFYAHSFEGLPPEARVFVEDRLLTASGFRSTVPMEDALEFGLTLEAVNALIDKRLIRQEERLNSPYVELTHDVLTKVVLKSREARKEQERHDKERDQLRRARRLTLMSLALAAVFLALGVLAAVQWRNARAAQAKTERAIASLVNLGDAFEDQLQAELFAELARDLEEFKDVPPIEGQIFHFRGLTAMARAREARQTAADKGGAAGYATDARDDFDTWAAIAEENLALYPGDADDWRMEVAKAHQAAGDAEILLSRAAEALDRYKLARAQLDALNETAGGRAAEETALSLAGLNARMLEANVRLKKDEEAARLHDETERLLGRYFPHDVDESRNPRAAYVLKKVKQRLLVFRPSNPRDWARSFLSAWQGPSAPALQPFFGETVSPYVGKGSADWLSIQKDKLYYYRSHPSISYALADEGFEETPAPDGGKVLEFDYDYCVLRADGNPLSGRAHMTVTLSQVRREWRISGLAERPVEGRTSPACPAAGGADPRP